MGHNILRSPQNLQHPSSTPATTSQTESVQNRWTTANGKEAKSDGRQFKVAMAICKEWNHAGNSSRVFTVPHVHQCRSLVSARTET